MISVKIRELRTRNGLTQKQVAEVLNIDRSTYAYYESGKTKPDITTFVKLSNLYGVSIDFMLKSEVLNNKQMLHDSKEMKDIGSIKGTDQFSKLKDDEKRLVMFYRVCKNKDSLLQMVRDFSLSQSS